jgi:putative ABC transport system ATP-binding protein
MDSIRLENIKFKYSGASKYTLDIPEFTLNKNKKAFLFGPSGCGKTTLLETLAGVLVPESGTVSVCGSELQKMSASQRDQFRAAKIGYIFQSFNLIPYLTVFENITLPLNLSPERRKNVPISDQEHIVLSMCQQLGIADYLNKPVTELSVGQQQRVAAARALLGKPELILADEPTSSLDYDHREKFIRLLFEMCDRSRTSILFVSHDRTLEKLFDESISLAQINTASMR